MAAGINGFNVYNGDLEFWDGDGDVTKPLIILLHGNRGDKDHMVNPGATGFNHNYSTQLPILEDFGWSSLPGLYHWPFELDPLKNIMSWRDFLKGQGYRTVAYSQISPTGLLDSIAPGMPYSPVQELGLVVDNVRIAYPDARLVLL